ncbi:uncharacterized protein BO97DRAFT_420794 [Aspergillus homomorphus CBS 101889]|uniref:Uncharacterized protein n=1 Tax=Aspergillus homomorphus (strain CBS 101889) TaxID=1450537 RepID=A0A395IBI9_ASPHC|nr:hypothetical protein BO97DRAFT_420794 [Aspergillus homomorphus CBS 101889]RAL16493.1 hypothetical protein BO97DRAFT_420794 [Aspergillus homomorphus CBS 101889]
MVYVAVSVLGLIEASISLIGQLHDAYKRQKEHANFLEGYEEELKSAKGIIQVVADEADLQTAEMSSQLVRMEALVQKLVGLLRSLSSENKSVARQFFHQLTQGSKDEKALSGLVDQIYRAKTDLIVLAQVAGVGLVRTTDNSIAANTEIIHRVDRHIQEVLGEGRGLKVGTLIGEDAKAGSSETREVPLSREDVAAMMGAQPGTERIIENNLTQQQALQINGPVGEDRWKSISRLVFRTEQGDRSEYPGKLSGVVLDVLSPSGESFDQGSSMTNNNGQSFMDQARNMMGNNNNNNNQGIMDQPRNKANETMNQAGNMMGRTQDSAKDTLSETESKADH